MTEFEDKHPRSAETGQFARKIQSAPEVTLSPAVDPDAAVPGILASLKTVMLEEGQLIRGWKSAVESGEKSAAEVLAELEAINAGGTCAEHPTGRWYGMVSAASCFQCRIAMATEHALRPGPEPVPVRRTARAAKEVMRGAVLSYDHDDDQGISTSVTAYNGDEAFNAAIRDMLDAPADAPVFITDTVTESGDYTKEYDHEMAVSAGGRTATFEGLHSLIRALERSDPDGPLEMALRLMRASKARRPLLYGPAAVYPKTGKPFFAHITQVFEHGQEVTIRIMRLNGFEEYLPISAISAITETDQTEIYPESD